MGVSWETVPTSACVLMISWMVSPGEARAGAVDIHRSRHGNGTVLPGHGRGRPITHRQQEQWAGILDPACTFGAG